MVSKVASELKTFAALLFVASACSCIYVTGVSSFERGPCEGPCTDAATEAAVDASACPSGMVFVASGGYVPVSKPGGGIVRIDNLCVDPTETTASAYQACVVAGKCTAPANRTFCNYGIPGRENDPINCVDLTQAKAYCAFVDKRLPTEDEWEWVARGGPLGYAYPWGNIAPAAADDPERMCWQGKTKHDDDMQWPNRPSGTCATKGFAATGGAFDFAGNVNEWTSTAEGTGFVFRGGSAFDPADVNTFKVGARRSGASQGYPGVGFRCFANAK